MAQSPRCQDCTRKLGTKLDRPSAGESYTNSRPRRPPPRYKSSDYTPLTSKRGHIRVLVLKGSSSENPLVECELVERAFTKQPTKEKSIKQPHKPNNSEQPAREVPTDWPPYEAVSWCWGTEKPKSYVNIRRGGKVYAKYVPSDLFAALKSLRYPKEDRYLWIDAICINQKDPREKSHQVEMMAEIYSSAMQVCIWLGKESDTSEMALKFIRDEVLQLQNFDELCESELSSEKWGALLDLMQRPWFSRRWVVQEIALARKATIYCGNNEISWKRFAVAVELFVEVETATHRLSEVMKKDPKFYHVPGWFEYVSALGASLLVDATGKLFRSYRVGPQLQTEIDDNTYPEVESDAESESSGDSKSSSYSDAGSDIEPSSAMDVPVAKGQPLLSLEYLVSYLSIFDVTKPHDAIYALLAISKDAVPSAGDDHPRRVLNLTEGALEEFTEKKKYNVDYVQAFSDVCKEFVKFCIETSEPTRALDIICRPWAPSERPKRLRKGLNPDRAALVNASAIGLPEKKTVSINAESSQEQKQDEHNKNNRGKENKQNKSGEVKHTKTWEMTDNEMRRDARRTQKDKAKNDIPLPSWIPQLTGAAHAMLPQAGVHTLKMGRKNADTLVGLPSFSQGLTRNYNAAESKEINMKIFRFQKRASMKHHSMYVEGFVLDKIIELEPSSQGGAIPATWARMAGWRDVPFSDPPDEFWRTLVADRGRDGKNPPVYYARACKETFIKGGLSSGSVNTTDLINNERCSVVAQFCRRVQAVIWNRSLIRTQHTKLGLAVQEAAQDDLVCILYGCSVPVVLRRIWKKREHVMEEVQEDVRLWKERLLNILEERRQNFIYTRMKRVFYRMIWGHWNLRMQAEWLEDKSWHEKWSNIKSEKTQNQNKMTKDELTIRIMGRKEEMGCFLQVKDESEKEYDERMQRKSFTFWKKQKKDKTDETEWDEPRLNWRAFELALRFGRRWKKLKPKAKELEEAKERLRILLREAKQKPPTTNQEKATETHSDHGGINGVSNNHETPDSEGKQRGEAADKTTSSANTLMEKFLRKYKLNPDMKLKEPENVFNPNDGEKVQRMKQNWCYYIVLGECYIHGMMDGEAMAFQNEKRLRPQVFELR